MLLVFIKKSHGNSTAVIQFKDDIINGLIQKSNSVPEVLEVPEPSYNKQ